MNKRRLLYSKKRNSPKQEMDLELDILEPPKVVISPKLFTTKRDFLTQNIVPACPVVPPKLRRCYGRGALNKEPKYGKAKLLSFCTDSEGHLSALYCRDLKETYFDQVFYRKFKMGEGSFGSVYKAICRDDNTLYAVKHFNANHSKSSKYIEVENMQKIGSHTNLLNFFMAWEEGDDVYIKMECCQMSLAQYSKINHNIHEDQLHEILHDVVKGLGYIHSMNYIHMDVKPDNVLMERGHYKLGDFGLLYSIKSTDKSEQLSSEGDSKYLAPEVLSGVYTAKADIFALGVTILELATDYIMPSNGYVWHALRAGGVPADLSEKISPKLQFLIYKMMAYETFDRPTALETMSCSLIRGITSKDTIIERTDYARLIAVDNPSYSNIIHADIRRVLNDIADSSGDNVFQTPISRTANRKIAFSPADGMPRILNQKSPATTECRRSPRMKLFL